MTALPSDHPASVLVDDRHYVILDRTTGVITVGPPDGQASAITLRLPSPAAGQAQSGPIVKLVDGAVEVMPGPGASLVEFELDGSLSFALFESGVLHSGPTDAERTVHDRLERFYAVRRGAGCTSLDLREVVTTDATISRGDGDLVRVAIAIAPGTGRDEPVIRLSVNAVAVPGFASDSVAISDPLDREAHLVALWANQVGTLGGLDVPGSVYPTLKLPELEYWTLNTFFDPDSWSVLNCLSFSGDSYLVGEARHVLDRVRDHITPDGRVPHHFDADRPEYVAISGATQPGPNIFYCLAVLDHVAATGDTEYLSSLWSDTLVPCVDALIRTLDPARDLLVSGGPLWIDVFRREGYTLDTNAMFVHLLHRMGEAADHLGDTGSVDRWGAIARAISVAVGGFWREDHYTTVLPGTGGDLDMIDSDDVLAALAGIADDARARAIFDRLERTGMHPGGRGTWVSGLPYGRDLCYDGNVGDSNCAFARIWWAEMRARRDRGDRAGFMGMFETVRADLLQHTWMGERYDEKGGMTRADGYHEYPGVLDILMREASYGIIVDVASVDVRPMRTGDLTYRVGEVVLERTGHDWRVRVAGSGERTFRFHDLAPGARYRWQDTTVIVPTDGTLSLRGQAGIEQRLSTVSS